MKKFKWPVYAAVMALYSPIVLADTPNTVAVNFSGEIEETECAVDSDVAPIDFGTVNVRELKDTGESATRPLRITLSDCNIVDGTKTARVTFQGKADDFNADLFKVGVAKGFGIEILEKNSSRVITPNTKSEAVAINNKEQVLNFKAKLKGNTQTIKPGTFNATVQALVEFE